MAWVSPEQIEQAKRVDILDYLQRHEPNNLKREGENRYTLKDHDSFVISNGKWCWNSRQIGCKTGTALNYLVQVRGYKFTDAVLTLTGSSPPNHQLTPTITDTPPKKKAFILPPRNGDNKRVISYLQSRGIDKSLIMDCVSSGTIYESAIFHNCVFTGKNEHGQTRFACMRSTTANYRRDVDGSDKRFGFLLAPNDPDSRNIACFEAPIDALSHKTMHLNGHEDFDGWRISLSGGNAFALTYFLEHHPAVDNVFICTDMDAAGQKAANRIWALTNEGSPFKYITVNSFPPLFGKDWNDTLMAVLKTEREQSRPGITHDKEVSL